MNEIMHELNSAFTNKAHDKRRLWEGSNVGVSLLKFKTPTSSVMRCGRTEKRETDGTFISTKFLTKFHIKAYPQINSFFLISRSVN